MESIIPVLLVVGGLIYKIYTNYQEEMEKVRKRQHGMPNRKPSPATVVIPKPNRSDAQSAKRRVAQPTVSKPAPSYDRKLGRPQPTKLSDRRPATTIIEENALTNREPNEVTRARKQREQRLLDRKIEVVAVEDELETSGNQTKFDLREAIIQAAILERPYKY
ncbi:hypothetical protein ACFSQ3_02585 [Sphingobacterium corticis]|uniref:Conjugal transfer protein n=1 Tax=Sphingobacterium corticis TaxID=1812823 RepID=A0ABW5NIG3_9SPHI